MIRLRTLGGLELRGHQDEELGTILAQPKRFALLFYLATAGPGLRRRDTLFGLFWPEADQRHARAALNQAVYFLRRELEHDVVRSRGNEEVGVDSDLLWCDSVAFEAALDAGDRHGALELYRGELLPGFYLSDAPVWERWLDGERERLRGRAATTAWEAAEQALARQRPAEAARLARQAVDIVPYDEVQLRRTLGLLARIGDRAGAARVFEDATRRFAADYDGELSEATRYMAERIRTGELEEVHVRAVGSGSTAGAPPASIPEAPPDAESGHSAESTGRPSNTAPSARSVSAGRRRHWTVAALAGVVLLAGALLSRLEIGATADGESVSDGVASDRLAVLLRSREPGTVVMDGASAATAATEPSDPGGIDVARELSDGLVRRLGRLTGIGVIERTSTGAYRNSSLPPAEIGSRLGARYLLQGSVTAGSLDSLLIDLRLVEAPTGQMLWTGRYDATPPGLAEVEGEIAVRVARALSIRLGAAERERLRDPGTANNDARREYLNGRYLLGKSDEASFRAALEHFRSALDLDPAYADAWSGLSDAYDHLAGIGAMSSAEAYGRARAAAERALEIDPDHAEAHASLAMALSHHYWQSDDAERHWRRAIELKPSDARTRRTYAGHLRNLGRFDEALAQATIARDLDPIPFFSHFELLVIPYFQGRYEHVVHSAEDLAASDPAYGYAHFLRALALVQLGRYNQALVALDAVDPAGEWTDARLIRSYIAARLGDVSEARGELNAYEEGPNPEARGFERAVLHIGLGEHDRAMASLEEAYEARVFRLRLLGHEPLFDPLRQDPRFERLLERIGLGGIETVGAAD